MALAVAERPESDPSDCEWRTFWQGHSVESEIAMADFYGLRHVLLKFLPRHGTVVEAGCGLGRYVFYLRALGLRAIGCERLLPALGAAQRWAAQERPESAHAFVAADVRCLPYRDNSLSGYISLGVVEHFPEGPAGALAEAHRALLPGGIAIVEVPNARAFDEYVHRAKRRLGALAGHRRVRGETLHEQPLSPDELGALMRQAGFALLHCAAADVIYPAWSLGVGRRWYGPLHWAERTMLARWGGLAVAVGIKTSRDMRCFVCGAAAGPKADLAVAICSGCRAALPPGVLAAYARGRVDAVRWQRLERAGPAADQHCLCSLCGNAYAEDKHFGDWGVTERVCPACIRKPVVNLSLAQQALKRVWRARAAAA
jgi:SAM-dependent methyltransferase